MAAAPRVPRAGGALPGDVVVDNAVANEGAAYTGHGGVRTRCKSPRNGFSARMSWQPERSRLRHGCHTHDAQDGSRDFLARLPCHPPHSHTAVHPRTASASTSLPVVPSSTSLERPRVVVHARVSRTRRASARASRTAFSVTRVNRIRRYI